MGVDLSKLSDFFPPTLIQWRIGQSKRSSNGIWAKVYGYVDARAVTARLDEVVGKANWTVEFMAVQDGYLAGVSIFVKPDDSNEHGQWVTKWDGADIKAVGRSGDDDVESRLKGCLSTAFKRAAVQWGIAAYIYDFDDLWATVLPGEASYGPGKRIGRTKEKNKDPEFYNWEPPEVPDWAIPIGWPKPTVKAVVQPAKANEKPPVWAGKPSQKPAKQQSSFDRAHEYFQTSNTAVLVANGMIRVHDSTNLTQTDKANLYALAVIRATTVLQTTDAEDRDKGMGIMVESGAWSLPDLERFRNIAFGNRMEESGVSN